MCDRYKKIKRSNSQTRLRPHLAPCVTNEEHTAMFQQSDYGEEEAQRLWKFGFSFHIVEPYVSQRHQRSSHVGIVHLHSTD